MSCPSVRELLYARAGLTRSTAGELPPEASLHLSTCSECTRLEQRLVRQVSVLESLDRHVAPAALEGAVVAALQAGHRQARIVSALESLSRPSMPVELELDRPAPPELAERLAADSERPLDARARRILRELTPLAAPAELDERVEALLAAGLAPARNRSRWQRIALATASLALLGWTGMRAVSEPAAPTYSFSVSRFDPQAGARPDAATWALVQGLTGDVLAVQR